MLELGEAGGGELSALGREVEVAAVAVAGPPLSVGAARVGVGQVFPPEIFAPEAFGYNLRPPNMIDIIWPPAEPFGGPRVELLPPETPVFRVQPQELPLAPHESPYFEPIDDGYAGVNPAPHDALYVFTDPVVATARATEYGLFEAGDVMFESTLGEVVDAAAFDGPVTVLRDFRFPGGESLVIVRPQ